MSAAFHAERLSGIGSSDMSDLFSLPSPYVTLPQAGGCVRKLAYIKRQMPADYERVTKPSMERGSDCEDIVARKLAEKTGWRLVRRKMLRHPEDAWLIAHIDREIHPGPGFLIPYARHSDGIFVARGVAELKTSTRGVAQKVERDGLNDGYLLQIQHQMLVGGYRWGAFAVLDVDSWSLAGPIIVEPQPTVQEHIRARARHFWKTYVEGESLPAALSSADPRCSECQWRRQCQSL